MAETRAKAISNLDLYCTFLLIITAMAARSRLTGNHRLCRSAKREVIAHRPSWWTVGPEGPSIIAAKTIVQVARPAARFESQDHE
jgi:hypothetical protein